MSFLWLERSPLKLDHPHARSLHILICRSLGNGLALNSKKSIYICIYNYIYIYMIVHFWYPYWKWKPVERPYIYHLPGDKFPYGFPAMVKVCKKPILQLDTLWSTNIALEITIVNSYINEFNGPFQIAMFYISRGWQWPTLAKSVYITIADIDDA